MENTMSFFNTKRNASRNQQPSETARLTENLSVALWKAEDKEGRTRLNFKIARINPSRPEDTYATLRPENVLELPACVAALAAVFSQHTHLSGELRDELASLAKGMNTFIEARQSNGEAGESSDENRMFNV
jgi:hypothetical protein